MIGAIWQAMSARQQARSAEDSAEAARKAASAAERQATAAERQAEAQEQQTRAMIEQVADERAARRARAARSDANAVKLLQPILRKIIAEIAEIRPSEGPQKAPSISSTSTTTPWRERLDGSRK